MSRQTGAALVLVVAAAFVALSVGKLVWESKKSNAKEFESKDNAEEAPKKVSERSVPVVKKKSVDAPKDDKKMTPAKLASYLNEVATLVENLVAQLPQLAQMVMAEAQAQGQFVPEEQVRAILAERLAQAVRMAEATVAEKLQVSEAEVQAAIQEMHTAPEVRAAIENFQRVIESSPLVQPAEVPSEITAERTLEIVAASLGAVVRAMEEALDIAKRAGMRDVAADAHMWQDLYVQKSAEYTSQIHEQYNVTEPILNAAVDKYNADQSFQERLQVLLAKHQERFQRLGL